MEDVKIITERLNRLEFLNKETLINKLKEFLIYSIKSKKEVDVKFVYELVELIINLRDLKEYVKEVECVNWNIDKSIGLGSFYPDVFLVEIYLSNILNSYQKEYRNLDSDSRKIAFFLRTFIITFHELEHANQMKLCLENSCTFETFLLRNSMNYLPRKELELYLIQKGYNAFELPKIIASRMELEYENDFVYSINPSERLSKVKSSYIALSCFFSFFQKYPFLKRELFYELYDSLLEGYEQYENPTETFMKQFDSINEWDQIQYLTSNFTEFEKAAYGLQLEKKEKKKLKQKQKIYYRSY